ncbi:MAG TPA: hypothetical protein PK718_00285 [Candidatus Methanofastidiosa archaeon]|nr:hypothetical protein [Candidatus Methanofastidiosa archaeon]
MLLTTSRRTSQRTRIFCRELASVLPFCDYLVRGKKSIRDIIDIGLRNAHERILIIETRDGNPFRLSSMDPSRGMEWSRYIDITVRTRKDMGLDVKVPPLNEDVPIGVIDEHDSGLLKTIMEVFNASRDVDSLLTIMITKKDEVFALDFIRNDISQRPIGPQIRVRRNADEDRA